MEFDVYSSDSKIGTNNGFLVVEGKASQIDPLTIFQLALIKQFSNIFQNLNFSKSQRICANQKVHITLPTTVGPLSAPAVRGQLNFVVVVISIVLDEVFLDTSPQWCHLTAQLRPFASVQLFRKTTIR